MTASEGVFGAVLFTNRWVLDASALLALLHAERGGEQVEPLLGQAAISSVNWAEVAQKSLERGRAPQALREDLEALGLQMVPFDAEDAEATAELWQAGRSHGLSLGGRACLATAGRLAVPAVTADRRWETLDVAVAVLVIR